jgi:5-dehydro-4-deoxyglucarate dehydratase
MLPLDVLRARIAEGIMAFPATPFTPDGALDEPCHSAHVAFLAQQQPTALVAAGGAGEIFSLTLPEHERVVGNTVANAHGVPVIGGAAYGTMMACEMARAVERAGGDAVLLLPPYLVHSEQAGLFRHIRAVAAAVSIAVIPYSRDNAVLAPETMELLARECPNIVALKDGTGDLAAVAAIKSRVGEQIAIINGAPTAEVFAPQFQALGVLSYSSAVFTFFPTLARRFFEALRAGDQALVTAILEGFYNPLVELRNRKHGYSVSIVKAGLRVAGKPAGPVRPPLIDLDADEEAVLGDLVSRAAQWIR